MSSSVMAGGAWGGRAACSAFDQSRIATPGPRRPARPARWSADARLQLIVCRPLIPVRGSSRAVRSSPLSTTAVMPSTVREVSAMFVARTTRRSARATRAASCSADGRLP